MEPGSPAAQETEVEVSPLMEKLSEEACWVLLGEVEVGRLAVAAAGDVDIFPLNFAVDGRSIVFRTAEGTKLVEIILNGRVAFEADGYHPADGEAWSVLVKGEAEMLERFSEIYAAQDLPLFPWNSAPKERFVKINVSSITGRRFKVGRTRSGHPEL